MHPSPLNGQAERNLLFAGLGLTLGILNRDNVIRAFTEWMLDKKLSLGDLLVEQKAITPEQKAVIEGAVEGQIEKEGGEEAALASLRNAKELESDLDHLQDSDIQQSMVAVKARQSFNPALQSMGGLEILQTMDSGASAQKLDSYATPLPEPPKPEGQSKDRFQRKAFLDAGALGEIWFAEDKELNRLVVVKYIKAENANNPLNKALFHLEGEVTGHLEHPNIAPVYGLGKDQENRNYYAMRYIQGAKLTKAIRDYHQIPESQSGKRQETLIGLLQTFQSACLAIEFAHSRGVIHCDLKPDNLMVGQFGETMVVDWGLVLVKEKKDLVSLDEASTVGPNEPLRISKVYKPSDSASGGLHEKQGGIRNYVGGTPAYMSPEQFRATRGGDVDEVTPVSDVFALGAVLFEILTNKAPLLPYKEIKENRQEYYDRIEKGNFPKPRSIKKDTPKALEAIVLKSMAANPKDRYSSARSLADDVKKWISDEPVIAHKEGFSEKSLRWMRKNKTAVAVTSMLLICGMISGIGFGVITQGYNEELKKSEGKAKENEAKALENAKAAILNQRVAEGNAYSGKLNLALQQLSENNLTSYFKTINDCQWNLRSCEYFFVSEKSSLGDPTIKTQSDYCNSTRAISNDLFLTSTNKIANLWSLKNGKLIKSLNSNLENAYFTTISKNGNFIGIIGERSTIRIFETKTGKVLGTFVGNGYDVKMILFTEDEKTLISYSDDKILRCWDIKNITNPKKIYLNKEASHISLAGGDNIIATTFNSIININLKTNEVKPIIYAKNDETYIFATISPDSKVLAIQYKTDINKFDFIKLPSLNKISTTAIMDHLPKNTYYSNIPFSFSPDGMYFVHSEANTIFVRETKSYSVISRIKTPSEPLSLQFCDSGNRLICGNGYGCHIIHNFLGEIISYQKSKTNTNYNINDYNNNKDLALHINNDFDVNLNSFTIENKKSENLKLLTGAIIAANKHETIIASCGYNQSNEIEIHNLADLSKRKILKCNHPDTINTNKFGFCDDGRYFAICEGNKIFTIYDTQKWIALPKPMGPVGQINALSLSPDGRLLVTGSADSKIIIYESETGKETGSFNAKSNGFSCVKFSPNAKTIAGMGLDSTLYLWDLKLGLVLANNLSVLNGIKEFIFNDDGSKLCVYEKNGNKLLIFDLNTKKIILQLEMPFYIGGINNSYKFSNSDEFIYGFCQAYFMKWDIKTGNIIEKVDLPPQQIGGPIHPSKNGFYFQKYYIKSSLISTTSNLQPRVFAKEYGALDAVQIIDPFNSVLFLNDPKTNFYGSPDNKTNLNNYRNIKKWYLKKQGTETPNLLALEFNDNKMPENFQNSINPYNRLSTSLNREIFAICGFNNGKGIKLFDSQNGFETFSYEDDNAYRCIALSDDGNLFAAGTNKNAINFFDIKKGKLINTIENLYSEPTCIKFCQSKNLLIIGQKNGLLTIWDIKNHSKVSEQQAHSCPINTLSFTPDTMRLFTGGSDGTIKIWDTDIFQERLAITTKSFLVFMHFILDGNELVCKFQDGTCLTLSFKQKPTYFTLPLQQTDPIAVAFTNNEKNISVKYSNDTILTFNKITGQLLPIPDDPAPLMPQAISLDGKYKVWIEKSTCYYDSIENINKQNEENQESLQQMHNSIPDFHKEQAEENEKSHSWFATVFHLKKLVELNPNDQDLKKRLQAAEAKLKEQNEKEEKELKQEQDRAKEPKKAG